MSKVFCNYCKNEKEDSFGEISGPHDCFFMCLDCQIKETINRIEMYKSKLSRLNYLKLSLHAERLNPEAPKGEVIV